jgi:glutathione S-transferase
MYCARFIAVLGWISHDSTLQGDKESWYKKIVPSGMLPALELDGRMITESDVILDALEGTFGPLGRSIRDPQVMRLRRLERELFGAWCEWLCRPARSSSHEKMAVSGFEETVGMVEAALGETEGPFFLGSEITVADIVFVPYVERMAASLYYYKGYTLRDPVAHPKLSAWFDGRPPSRLHLSVC